MTDLKAIVESIKHWEENIRNLKKYSYFGKSVYAHRLAILFDQNKENTAFFHYGGNKCPCCQVAQGRIKLQKKEIGNVEKGECVQLCPAGKLLKTTCLEYGWEKLNISLIGSPILTHSITEYDKQSLEKINPKIIFISEVILTWLQDAKKLITQKGKTNDRQI